jgi:putative DNA primase/helicase
MTTPYDALPLEMLGLRQFVTWKLIQRPTEEKPTKVPYQLSGIEAKSTDPTTWTTFDAVRYIPQTSQGGIGFVFGAGIAGIDLDHIFLPNGNIDEKFLSIIVALKDTYIEYSPSGTGLHVYFRVTEPPYEKGRKKGQVEIYSSKRFFTLTGRRFRDSPSVLRVYDAQFIRDLLDPFINPVQQVLVKPHLSVTPVDLEDNEILSFCRRAGNSTKFNRLWDGNTSGYNSNSEADLGFCCMLAFYTRDRNQIQRLWLHSGLFRPKMDRADYVNATVTAALEQVRDGYTPRRQVTVTTKFPSFGKQRRILL